MPFWRKQEDWPIGMFDHTNNLAEKAHKKPQEVAIFYRIHKKGSSAIDNMPPGRHHDEHHGPGRGRGHHEPGRGPPHHGPGRGRGHHHEHPHPPPPPHHHHGPGRGRGHHEHPHPPPPPHHHHHQHHEEHSPPPPPPHRSEAEDLTGRVEDLKINQEAKPQRTGKPTNRFDASAAKPTNRFDASAAYAKDDDDDEKKSGLFGLSNKAKIGIGLGAAAAAIGGGVAAHHHYTKKLNSGSKAEEKKDDEETAAEEGVEVTEEEPEITVAETTN